MEGSGSTWANQIPLVTLVFVIFAAGILYNKVANLMNMLTEFKNSVAKDFKTLKDEAEKDVAILRASVEKDLHELKSDFKESAKDQGNRIGILEGDVKSAIRAEAVRSELTGRHHSSVPVEVK